ncbi:MAG TPA: glycosyl hydrolase [Opitutaceae bacterium]|nr:glycosyl hydrolase [Opitutaceae bacterium]
MKTPARLLLPLLAVVSLSACAPRPSSLEHPWQKLSNPTAAELADHFAAPPSEFSSQVTWGWSGVITREVIARDLDHLLAMNIHQAWVEPGRNPEAPYLSPAYFENVRIAVEEAKKRGMHLWFDDDGGYPSGFAGGKFTLERPDLDMKALAPAEQVPVEPGKVFSRALDANTICALALNLDTGDAQVIEPKGGQVEWTAPATGRWAVALPRWVFRSGVTKSANNKSGGKDAEHSLMDYLDPRADALFITWTFEAYKKVVGDEFGKTFLGFRGDEAAYGFNPWTPNFPAEFQKRKGYDIRPHLPAIAAIQLGRGGRGNAAPPAADNLDAAHRAYADYCDVWSDLMGRNFFSAGALWCADNHLQMQTHIEHEEILPQLAGANGDYFKAMRDVQVPGIDVIWHQMWHDVVADFPKLASSAAHLDGHPQSMTETFAAMNGNYPTPNLEEAGWILNHEIGLGITHVEFMSMRASTGGGPVGAPLPSAAPAAARGTNPASSPAPLMRGAAPNGYRYITDPKFPELAQYVNRTTYVLGQGRPAAQVGVYIPSSSFWFGPAANRSFLAIVHALLEHQRDLDFVDEAALAQTLKLQGGELVNLSGQAYRGIVVPPVDAISQAALDRLKAFAKAGGHVVFLGDAPRLVMGRNFLTATGPADISWAVTEPSGEVTPKVLSALPVPDLALDQAAPGLKYNHRQLKDGDVYFLFNEGDAPLSLKATLAVNGPARQAQSWDAATGKIEGLPGAAFAAGKMTLPLELAPWATELVVVSSGTAKVASVSIK